MVTIVQREISKSNFKSHALEVMRDVEKSGDDVVITSQGKPVLIVTKFKQKDVSPLEKLRNSVVKYNSPTEPVSGNNWERS